MKHAFLLGISVALLSSCNKSDPAAAASSAAASAVAAPPVGSLLGFEGDITLIAKSKKDAKPTPPITVSVKGARLRFDAPENMETGPKFPERPHVVLNIPEKKLYAIMDREKQVMVIGLDSFGSQLSQWKRPEDRAAGDGTPPKVTKTGHKDVVAGYSCEDWEIVNAKGERTRVCVSGESTSWFSIPSLVLPAEHAWAKELLDGQHLPLRFISFDTAGTEESRLEVTQLEKKALSDSIFEIPAGYRVMDMSEMMRGMGNMGAMMAAARGMAPGGMPAGLPSGMPSGLPPGMNLQMPANVKMPANMEEMMKTMQERAKAAGVQLPAAPKQ